MIKQQIEFLSGFVLEKRWQQLQQTLLQRTQYLTVCLENIYQAQNASAVLRTCEAIGVQDIYIIENANTYRIDPEVALGTDKWLSVHKYMKEESTSHVIKHLRKKGYRIVATTPRENSQRLNDFKIEDGKTALFFGTEQTGLSDEMMDQADEFLHIPMYGFVESFNISVSASIILYTLAQRMRDSEIDWHLSPKEYDRIMLEWLKSSIRSSDLLLKRFEESNSLQAYKEPTR